MHSHAPPFRCCCSPVQPWRARDSHAPIRTAARTAPRAAIETPALPRQPAPAPRSPEPLTTPRRVPSPLTRLRARSQRTCSAIGLAPPGYTYKIAFRQDVVGQFSARKPSDSKLAHPRKPLCRIAGQAKALGRESRLCPGWRKLVVPQRVGLRSGAAALRGAAGRSRGGWLRLHLDASARAGCSAGDSSGVPELVAFAQQPSGGERAARRRVLQGGERRRLVEYLPPRLRDQRKGTLRSLGRHERRAIQSAFMRGTFACELTKLGQPFRLRLSSAPLGLDLLAQLAQANGEDREAAGDAFQREVALDERVGLPDTRELAAQGFVSHPWPGWAGGGHGECTHDGSRHPLRAARLTSRSAARASRGASRRFLRTNLRAHPLDLLWLIVSELRVAKNLKVTSIARMNSLATRIQMQSVQRFALSVDETAAAVGLSSRYVRGLIADGRLRAIRTGRRVLVPIAELERFTRIAEPEVSDVQ
jgi:excisionase family DNA binding protein